MVQLQGHLLTVIEASVSKYMEVLIALGIMLVAQVTKKWITPKWGPTGVHVVVFLLALIVTAVQFWANNDAQVMAILKQAGVLLVATVGTYHVIFEKLGNVMSKNLLS